MTTNNCVESVSKQQPILHIHKKKNTGIMARNSNEYDWKLHADFFAPIWFKRLHYHKFGFDIELKLTQNL